MKSKMIKCLSLLLLFGITGCNSNAPFKPIDDDGHSIFDDYGDDEEQGGKEGGQEEQKEDDEEKQEENPEEPMTIKDCNGTKKSKEYEEKGYTSLYDDLNFKYGFLASKPDFGASTNGNPMHTEKIKFYPEYTQRPVWSIAQWSSRYDFLGTTENDGFTHETSDNGLAHKLTSKGKAVDGEMVPGKIVEVISKSGEIYLESNCSVEYEKPRTSSDPWVHLLFGQDFGVKAGPVSKMSSIIMETDFTIDKCENKMGSNYNSAIHTAQVCWYITLQNLNTNSLDYGKYIWFGVQLFDYRTAGKSSNLYYAFDTGTSTAIYNPATASYFADGKQPIVGERKVAKFDIVEIAAQAFEIAKRDGFFTVSNYEDIYIGSTNFGFEVPGTFDIGTTFHNISVYYKK